MNGAPGVYSARYAGEGHDSEANMQKLLKELEGKENRNAQFRTAFALIIDGKKELFEGIVKGKIITQKKGSEGFGYDPLFVPDGYTETFAELGADIKNKISHRAVATHFNETVIRYTYYTVFQSIFMLWTTGYRRVEKLSFLPKSNPL